MLHPLRPWPSVVIDPSEIVSRVLIGAWLPSLACDWARVRNRERPLSACLGLGQLLAGAWLTTLVRNILHPRLFLRTKISDTKRRVKQEINIIV